MAYTQLTQAERTLIGAYRKDGLSYRAIGQRLGRNGGALCREYHRNICSGDIGYDPEFAHYHAKNRRKKCNKQRPQKIARGSVLALYIFEHLRARWSPEDISVKLQECRVIDTPKNSKDAQRAIVEDELLRKTYIFDAVPSVSAKTIYTFIRKEHPEFLRYFSVLSHKKPRPRGQGRKELIKGRTWIEERPEEADAREEIGHWEGDTIISGCRKQAIGTMADRATGYYIAAKMADRTAAEFNRAITKRMASLPPEARKTSTKDNGPEFAEHEAFAAALEMAVFFAHPYHSWERPVNERTNRELRRFFPKGVDFADIEEWELDRAVHLINHKPRQRLGYRSPHAVFHERLGVAL